MDRSAAEGRMTILQNEDAFVEAMGLVVAAIHRETDTKIAALDAKIARLETALSAFAFKGAWVEGQRYKRGNFCSPGGAVYHCQVDTLTRPGTDDKVWTLAVPRARDGRDGKDYVAPERVVRSHR
jgi:hypothetical protein